MNKGVNYSAAAFFLVFSIASLNALDWGVVFDNRSDVDMQENTDAELQQRDKVSLWMEQVWNSGEETQYSFSGNIYYLYNEDKDHIFNTDLLKFSAKKGGLFNGTAVLDGSIGRFRFSDPTGLVLNHVADGAEAAFDFGFLTLTSAAGYTGLQVKPEANVSMTLSDSLDESDDDVYFAPKRIFEQTRMEFPLLMEGQKITLEGLFQQDLRDSSDVLDSLHVTGSAEGTVPGGLFYKASGAFARDLTNELSGYMGTGAIYLYMKELLNSKVSLGGMVASEDFFSISAPTLGLIYSPAIGDLSRIDFGYSMRPWADRFAPLMRNIQFSTAARAYLSAGEYTGSEIEGGMRIRPTSDFGASLTGGVYLPDQGDTAGLLRLEFSLGL